MSLGAVTCFDFNLKIVALGFKAVKIAALGFKAVYYIKLIKMAELLQERFYYKNMYKMNAF